MSLEYHISEDAYISPQDLDKDTFSNIDTIDIGCGAGYRLTHPSTLGIDIDPEDFFSHEKELFQLVLDSSGGFCAIMKCSADDPNTAAPRLRQKIIRGRFFEVLPKIPDGKIRTWIIDFPSKRLFDDAHGKSHIQTIQEMLANKLTSDDRCMITTSDKEMPSFVSKLLGDTEGSFECETIHINSESPNLENEPNTICTLVAGRLVDMVNYQIERRIYTKR